MIGGASREGGTIAEDEDATRFLMCVEDAEAHLAATKAELQGYCDSWGRVESLTRRFLIDGWANLAKVIFEMMMCLEWAHQPVLCHITMATAVAGPILAPDGDIGLPGPYTNLLVFFFLMR